MRTLLLGLKRLLRLLATGFGYDFAFDVFETVSVLVFTVEYFLRLWSCVEDDSLKPSSSWFSVRQRYACTFFPLVDLAAILPWYV